MNLDSKLNQGWIQLLQNNTQLLCTTVSEACECHPATINKDEQAIQDLILCMDDFDADPFDESAPQLRFPQPGAITSSAVLENLRYALEEREKKSDDLLEQRLFSKELSLKVRVTKNRD